MNAILALIGKNKYHRTIWINGYVFILQIDGALDNKIDGLIIAYWNSKGFNGENSNFT